MERPAGSEAAARPPSGHDRRVEAFLGALLRAGVLVAAGFVAAGGAVLLARHGGERPTFGTFAGEPEDLRTAHGIVRGALALRGRAIVQLGLGLLVATPVLRVASSLVVFAWEKDLAYVLLTALVLGLLLLGLAGAIA